MLEHIRVLIIFGVDILPYRRSERELSRLAKGEIEDTSKRANVSKQKQGSSNIQDILRGHGYDFEPH